MGTNSCSNSQGSYECYCKPGYSGQKCDSVSCSSPGYAGPECLDVDECTEMPELCLNGKCTNTDGSYICDCNEGYNRFNSYCKDIDECIIENFCGVDGVCYNKKGGWECECATGYISRPHSAYITNIGNECIDIDECKEYDGLCKENEICVNTEGTYFCEKL